MAMVCSRTNVWVLLLVLGVLAQASLRAGSRLRKQRWSEGVLVTTRRHLAPGFKPLREGPVRVAFFDADSTLRVSRSGSVSANHRRDVMLLPGVARKLRELQKQGFLIAVVSNQGGVAHGFLTKQTAEAALAFLAHLLARKGAYVSYFDFAETKDKYRKPGTEMAWEAERVIHQALGRKVDWVRSFMVGDSAWKRKKDVEPDGTPGEDFSNSDRHFAENVRKERGLSDDGFRFYHPREFFGWEKLGVRNFRKRDDVIRFRAQHPEF
jgi:DNA 3'-phosphatase